MGVTVHELLREPFANRTRQQKVNIVLEGKPRPALEHLRSAAETNNYFNSDGIKLRSSKFVIIFDTVSYDHVEWLTGCDVRQALFCWPCLLFRSITVHDNSWNKKGFDLNNLGEKIKQHERDILHIQSILDLQLFSSTIKVDPGPLPIQKKDIKKNREIAKQIIDVICYLVTQQKRPRVGSKNDLEVEDCLENLHFLRDYNFLPTSLIDDGVNKIQKDPKIIVDMIEAITNTMKKAIQEELLHSRYVSVILSEHSAERTKSQISTVLRYLKDGEVCERFFGFSNLERVKIYRKICQIITKVIKDLHLFGRIIAFSLDGSILPSVQAYYEVKQELRYCHPHVHFVPCHFHDLDDVLIRSLSSSAECDLFFKHIMTLASCFSPESSVCLEFNDLKIFENASSEMSSYEIFHPSVVKLCSNYSAFLNIIKIHRYSIIHAFDNALLSNENLKETDVIKLTGLRSFLRDFENVFLLETLLKLFDIVAPLVEASKSSFPGAAFDNNLVKCVLKSLEDEVKDDAFDPFWTKIVSELMETENDIRLASFFEKKRNSSFKLLLNIAESMRNQIKFRFEDSFKLGFCHILDLESSAKLLNANHVHSLIINFGQSFEYKFLDREIKLVVGNRSAMDSESVHQLYKFFATSGLGNSFTNLNKLCELVLTLPSTIPNIESKSTWTKLDEMNSWSYGAHKQHSRDITFLCVEQEYLKELKKKKSFYDDVISEFREHSKTMDIP